MTTPVLRDRPTVNTARPHAGTADHWRERLPEIAQAASDLSVRGRCGTRSAERVIRLAKEALGLLVRNGADSRSWSRVAAETHAAYMDLLLEGVTSRAPLAPAVGPDTGPDPFEGKRHIRSGPAAPVRLIPVAPVYERDLHSYSQGKRHTASDEDAPTVCPECGFRQCECSPPLSELAAMSRQVARDLGCSVSLADCVVGRPRRPLGRR